MPRLRPETMITYGLTYDAWSVFADKVRELVLSRGCRTIYEVGGGANPTLPLEFVQQHGLDYVLLDISEEELAEAPAGYRTRVQDVTGPIVGEQGTYDLVFSEMLAEHVKDGRAFHGNMQALLKPGGVAFHFFPTLYAPPFVVNLLLPERLTYFLLNLLQAGRERTGWLGKFLAYYRWCRGHYARQLRRYESVGFELVSYTGYFGHPGYYRKVSFIERLHRALAAWLCRHPVPWLTSFAHVVLEKRPERTA